MRASHQPYGRGCGRSAKPALQADYMISKIIAVASLVMLPFSAALWYRSHQTPYQHRFDATLYKSAWVYLRQGICAVHILNMPTKTASRSSFDTGLNYDAVPGNRRLMFSSEWKGPYRMTWVVFPLWMTTALLALTGTVPLLLTPGRQWLRRLRGQCVMCAYDLTANRSGRCPECGHRLA